MIGRVLIVAGSDSGAGAGIQADLKTVMALGGYATTALTALTAQNTLGVADIHPVPPDFVGRQIDAVLADIGADCVKTGMLVSAAVIDCVADRLERLRPRLPLVVDPVMISTSGTRLLDEDAVATMLRRLIAGAAVVTPNVPEAEALTGIAIASLDDMRRAGEALLQTGAAAAAITGGHLAGEVVRDLVVTPGESYVLEAPRLATRSSHGTGCTYASAIATGLAQGMELRRAVERAHAFVQQALRAAPGLGAGNGPLGHGFQTTGA